MSLERYAWYQALKYGRIYHISDKYAGYLRLTIKIIATELVILGVLALSMVYHLKTNAGQFIHTFILSMRHVPDTDEIWKESKNLETLNLDGCLNNVFDSLTNGFGVITISGVLCFTLSVWRSRKLNYTVCLAACVFILLLALVAESREMKKFDNVLTPLQNSTMAKMRVALIENQRLLTSELVSALYMLTLQGRCCGIESRADMDMLKEYPPPRKKHKSDVSGLSKKRKGRGHPFYKICSDNSDWVKGCYVHIFEMYLKPFVRQTFGAAMFGQVIIFALLIIQNEVPPTKEEATRVLFCDRKPTMFPVD